MSRLLLLLAFCMDPCVLWAQQSLDLSTVIPQQLWTIEFHINAQTYQQIQNKMPSGVTIPVDSVHLAGEKLAIHSLQTRGKTSAGFRRKSYQVVLDSFIILSEGGSQVKLNQFNLLNLALDKHYLHNYFALSCFDLLGISKLFKKYIEVRINGKTEGVYLLTQRPVDYAFNTKQATVVIRRLNSGTIENEKIADDTDPAYLKQCELKFKEINDLRKKYAGSALAEALDERLVLQEYFDWLAWNYWVRNGDYTDEIFYYSAARPIRFHLLPWDFDDIFAVAPHEGQARRDQQLGEKLIFSSEDNLDRVIAKDEVLYDLYLRRLKHVLTLLGDPSILKQIFEQEYAALLPFFQQPEIIAMSHYDQNPTDLQQMETQIKNMFHYLLRRAKTTLDKIPQND